MFQALKSTAKSIAHNAANQAADSAKTSAKQAVEQAIVGQSGTKGGERVIKGCTCTCPSAAQSGGAGARIDVPNLNAYADKLVNLISAHVRKLYIPTKKDLVHIESALNRLVASGVDLTDEVVVHDLVYTTSLDGIDGYSELVDALKTVIARGATISQRGGGARVPIWSPNAPSFR